MYICACYAAALLSLLSPAVLSTLKVNVFPPCSATSNNKILFALPCSVTNTKNSPPPCSVANTKNATFPCLKRYQHQQRRFPFLAVLPPSLRVHFPPHIVTNTPSTVIAQHRIPPGTNTSNSSSPTPRTTFHDPCCDTNTR